MNPFILLDIWVAFWIEAAVTNTFRLGGAVFRASLPEDMR